MQLQKRTPCPNWLFTFLLLSWLHELWLTRGLLATALPAATWNLATLFHFSAWSFYSLLYLMPIALIAVGVRRFTHTHHWLKLALVYGLSTLLLLLLCVDQLIYGLYAFHFNGFVWNLITTPGGIGSLGSSSTTVLSAALLILQVTAIQALLLWVSRRGLLFCAARSRSFRWAAAAAGTLFLVQGTVYGISDINQYGPVLDGSRAYPLFQRIRFRSLAARFGYQRSEQASGPALQQSQSAVRYPLQPPHYDDLATPPNILLLVGESLRADQLSPATMPNTWQFGLENLRFEQHYSSGNGTREALFGMFYGLYGSYWEQFLHARRSPLLMDRLQQLGYTFDIRTSATFTYPEFDRTLFANMPATSVHESGDVLPPWQRDQLNMDALLDFLRERDSGKPFMGFFFLESTHASYSFPPQHALHDEYMQDVNYMKLKKEGLASEAAPLLNRYRNAGYWIDVQLGRLYDELERQQLLDSTIVIVTGDHGEEFMEKQSWGHNSSFVEEQTRVPLVIHWPGKQQDVIKSLTSHLDIATTLLQRLGLANAVEDYSLGRNLFDTTARRHVVLSDWHSLGIVTPDLKYRMPYLQNNVDNWPATDAGDRQLTPAEADARLRAAQPLLLETMQNFTRFTSTAAGTAAD